MMKRTAVILALLLVLGLFAGCQWYGYRPPSATFAHKIHTKPLDQKGFECQDCHRFSKIEERDFRKAVAASERTLFPGKAICHYCHVETETRIGGASGSCAMCHLDMYAIRPETHLLKEWKKFHALEAKNDRNSCNTCHREWFCADCHTRRDSIQTLMHPRTYRFFHSVEAQIDPASCGACHPFRFCIDCHSGKQRRYN